MRYRKIDVRLWGDQKFRTLTPLQPGGQALFLYLLTNPNITSIPGIFRAGPALMAEELGWPIEDFREAFDELFQQGLVNADLLSRVIFIPNAIKYNKPQSPNVIKSWASHWDEIPECELKNIAYQVFKVFCDGMGDTFGKVFHEAIAKPSLKTMQNQDQEQKEEQEQETETIENSLSSSVLTGKQDPTSVREVFQYWQVIMNHPQAKFDLKRKKKIRSALDLGFTVAQLKQAIDGCANTPFNMGENKQKQIYDGIGLIFKDAEQIERFIQNAINASLNSRVSQIDQIAEGAL